MNFEIIEKVKLLSELVQKQNLKRLEDSLTESSALYLEENLKRALRSGKTEQEVLEHLDAKIEKIELEIAQ